MLRNRQQKHTANPLPTSPKRDSDRMKHDATTYNDRKLRQIGMTAELANQTETVLFFADTHSLKN